MTPQGVGDMNPIRVFFGRCIFPLVERRGAYVVDSAFANLMKVLAYRPGILYWLLVSQMGTAGVRGVGFGKKCVKIPKNVHFGCT